MDRNAKPVIAMMYDFDKTLCTKDMQEYGFIPNLGLKPEQFWSEAGSLAKDHKMDRVLSYMYLMIRKSHDHHSSIRRDTFVSLGSSIEFYPGVIDWFSRINRYGREIGADVEHYIISSGLKEIIEGCQIYKEFKEVYACEFYYDENGVAVWLETPLSQISGRMPEDLVDRGIAAPAGSTLREIYEQRTPLYARYADVIVASRDGEDDTARQVEEILRTVGIHL